MWYARNQPSHAYILEEIVSRSLPVVNFYPAGMTPVCDTCQLDNARHQYVLDEIASYDQPGMAGLGFFGALAALAGRQGRKSRVKRLRPVIAKGRVFHPQVAAQQQGQVPGYGSGGASGGDAMQYVAAAELGVQAEQASRWQRPIVQSSGAEKIQRSPMGLDRLMASGAQIGAGSGVRALTKEQRKLNEAYAREEARQVAEKEAAYQWAKKEWGGIPGVTIKRVP